MSVDGIAHFALVNRTDQDEVRANLEEFYEVDEAAFKSLYEFYLDAAKPSCYDCPVIGVMALRALTGRTTAEESLGVVQSLQRNCGGTKAVNRDNEIFGEDTISVCPQATLLRQLGV